MRHALCALPKCYEQIHPLTDQCLSGFSFSSYRGIFIKRTALQLQSEGWKVSVVTPKIFRESEYFEEEKGVRIFRFPFFAGDRLLIEYSKIPYLRMILYYITGTFLYPLCDA